MIIHFYLAKRYFFVLLQVFFALLVIIYVGEIAEQARRYSSYDLLFIQAMSLALLVLPLSMLLMLPFIILISACFTFFSLARSNELIATRAAGLSAKKILLGPGIVVFLVSILAPLLWHPAAIAAKESYLNKRFLYINIAHQSSSVTDNGIWLRQKTAEGSMFINIKQISENQNRLTGLQIYQYDHNGNATYQINAREARVVVNNWVLYDTKQWALSDETPEKTAITRKVIVITTNMSSKDISNGLTSENELSFTELLKSIRDYKAKGLSTRRQELLFWIEIAAPAMLLAMLIIGAAFMMRPSRLARAGLMAFYAFLFAFGAFFFNNFIQVLGVNENNPVILAAFAAPLIALMLAVIVLLQLEDG